MNRLRLVSLDVKNHGPKLLAELHAALTRYVVLPSPEATDAVVLWIAATHAVQAWNCAPRLDITSPVKRCGKSRLLDIIEATCHDPLLTVNISPAALGINMVTRRDSVQPQPDQQGRVWRTGPRSAPADTGRDDHVRGASAWPQRHSPGR